MTTRNKEQHAAYMRQYYKTHASAHLKARLYHIIRRCTDPSFKGYQNYGGRGIGVCQEWRDDPESFVTWAKASGWEMGLQIDRIDNNGDYTPENCRWTTSQNNNRNRRNNKLDVLKVAEIRKLCAAGVPDGAIATQFGVHRALIFRIRKNQQWR